MTKQIVGVMVAAIAAVGMTASAATYHVATTGSDETGDGTSGNPFASVQRALTAATEDGDVVQLAAGTYTGMPTTDKAASGSAWQGSYLGVLDHKVTVCGAGSEGENATILVCSAPASRVPSGFWLEHEEAVVQDLAITKALIVSSWPSNHEPLRGGALHVAKGTVRNVRVFGCQSGSNISRPTVYLGGAASLVENCVITNVGGGTYCQSAAIRCDGGTVKGCYLADCKAGSELSSRDRTPGIRLDGGSVIGCQIVGLSGGDLAAGLYVTGDALIEKTLLKGNTCSGKGWCAGAVYCAETGTKTFKNCIFDGNVTKANDTDSAAALRFESATAKLYHCTFINNSCNNGNGTGALRANRSTVTVKGCVFWGNSGSDVDFSSVNGSSLTRTYSCWAGATEGADGNTAQNPLVNPETYEPTGATAVDAVRCGENLVTDDYYGKLRPVYPDPAEEDSDYPDMGAVEQNKEDEGDLTVTELAVTAKRFRAGETPTLSCTFVAKDQNLESCTYSLVCGEREVVLTDANLVQTLPADLPLGIYDVNVRVENAKGVVGVSSNAAFLACLPSECYVSVDGSETFPYDTPAKGARSLAVAVANVLGVEGDPAVVRVCDGDYGLMAGTNWTIDVAGNKCAGLARLAEPIRVIGNAAHPENVRIAYTNATTVAGGGLAVEHAEAEVVGLTISGASGRYGTNAGTPYGLALCQTAGVVSNCVFTGISQGLDSRQGSSDPMLLVKGGLARNLVFRDSCDNGPMTLGGTQGRERIGMLVSGGTVDGLLVDNIMAKYPDAAKIVGLDVSGGAVSNLIVRNVTIANLTQWMDGAFAAGLRQTGGTIVNVRVSCCTNNGVYAEKTGFAGFAAQGGSAMNVLVEKCSGKTDSNASCGAGLKLAGGTVVNATVADNTAVSGTTAGLVASAGTLANSIVWANESEAETPICLTRTGGALSHCCINGLPAEKDADGNFAADPRFRKPSAGDYHLKGASPCVRGGEASYWMEVADPTDLDGQPRLDRKGRVGLGCYAGVLSGLMLMVQ